jgi:hypothetical protein
MMTSAPHGDVRPEQPIPHPEELFVSFDLPFEIARLQAETGYEAEGHAGRTLTKAPELRVVLEAMKAGTLIALDGTPDLVSLEVMLFEV